MTSASGAVNCSKIAITLIDLGPEGEKGDASLCNRLFSTAPDRIVAMGRVCIAIIAALLSVEISAAGQDTNSSAVYPNELAQYQLHSSAAWRKLIPSKSTMADVRRVLGNPDNAYDVEVYTEPYPGDDAARKPVFLYTGLTPDWYVLVYFSKYCFRDHPSDPSGSRICSIDLAPKHQLVFSAIKFSAAFKKEHVTAVDGAWDSYTDDSGLQYDVYTNVTPHSNHQPGDLFRISYGLPASETAKS